MSASASAIAFPRIKNSLNLGSFEAMTCGEAQILDIHFEVIINKHNIIKIGKRKFLKVLTNS